MKLLVQHLLHKTLLIYAEIETILDLTGIYLYNLCIRLRVLTYHTVAIP